ncbi:hypothetical protein [Haloechinothrix sp. LS1_15]|uniref:hypothetical protein n=1 Tax=Haloechinothrix sp. LS1_15 TaxID=2652248 RepID=UPI002944D23C|nr:hypothetical protein [Haloechinothrix sp. LS1_15]MDV6012362.1 hypothetical protein [Haloechinothrix sp. LS1_15]
MSTARMRGRGLLVLGLVGVIVVALLPGQAPALQAQHTKGPVVPEIPTTITASKLSLSGLCYDGVVELPTVNGPVESLKFKASSLRIDDATISLPDDPAIRIDTPRVHVDTAFGERTELYLRRLTGKMIDGLITYEVDYSPENPPPASFPWMSFTDVTVGLHALDGAEISMPDPSLEVGGGHIPLPPMDGDADDPDGGDGLTTCLL